MAGDAALPRPPRRQLAQLTEFERGWAAALEAARAWHEAKAKQVLVMAKRTRFPKTLENQAEVHRHAAEVMPTLTPDPS